MIDFTKPVQTCGGMEARVYAMDGGGLYPVHGAFRLSATSVWTQNQWNEDGKSDHRMYVTRGTELDLINLPVKYARKIFVNCYSVGDCHLLSNWLSVWSTRADADNQDGAGRLFKRIACVEAVIEFTEGEGL